MEPVSLGESTASQTMTYPRSLLVPYIHPSAWKWNSRKYATRKQRASNGKITHLRDAPALATCYACRTLCNKQRGGLRSPAPL